MTTLSQNWLNQDIPTEEIASWIAEIEREYPTLPEHEQRDARRQLKQLRAELEHRSEEMRITAERRYFDCIEAYARTIEPGGFALPF